jgi:Arc/MetJ-type ribon-helix-helix transcriptional regulator
MQRIQVFLHEDQYAALKQLARFSGVAQSDLIRQGVDLLLKSREKRQQDWKDAAQKLQGIWQDHSELESSQRSIRQGLNTRMERHSHE